MPSRTLMLVTMTSLVGCRAEPLEIDVVKGLDALCANHDAAACSALARLHEVGASSSAWYDIDGWPRRTKVFIRANDKQLAIRLYDEACKEGSVSDCQLRDQLRPESQPAEATPGPK